MRIWPLIASLLLNGLAFLILTRAPEHRFPALGAQIAPVDLSKYLVTQVELAKPTEAASPRKQLKEAPVRESRITNKSRPLVSASARPGTSRWRALAAQGKDSDLEIFAYGTIPVLEANGVKLAFDLRRPRGITYLFDLRTHRLAVGAVPADAVIRELELGPSDFVSDRRQVERCLQAPPRAFALYPPELYAVMKGLAYEALKRSGARLDEVKVVKVRLQIIHGTDFMVTLLS
jgi:hypothetical protein